MAVELAEEIWSLLEYATKLAILRLFSFLSHPHHFMLSVTGNKHTRKFKIGCD
jgi:hypothetical protein